MDLYTAEKLFLERVRAVEEAAERRARLAPPTTAAWQPRVWIAGRLRALADRLDNRPDQRRPEEPRLVRA